VPVGLSPPQSDPDQCCQRYRHRGNRFGDRRSDEANRVAICIGKEPGDLAEAVDPVDRGVHRSRRIEGREDIVAIDVPVLDPACVGKEPDYLSGVVDSKGLRKG
jgi:hypothetical protein